MVDVVRGFIGLIIQIITSTTGLFLLNLGYLLFGSYVFYVLESPHEAQLVSDLADRRITLIQQLDALEKAAKAAPTDTTTAKDSSSDLKKNASIYLAQYEEKLGKGSPVGQESSGSSVQWVKSQADLGVRPVYGSGGSRVQLVKSPTGLCVRWANSPVGQEYSGSRGPAGLWVQNPAGQESDMCMCPVGQ
ncbi:hypothetical protein Btru_005135 [Bulinus truncatus]|nr:hypothetical protein Btru_005135 [Bulinus truncatus]